MKTIDWNERTDAVLLLAAVNNFAASRLSSSVVCASPLIG